MKLYRKVYNRKKADDRGFTLVELIIVVAILAVLIGMLAPQYTKYVEKSRRAADVSNMEKFIRTIKVMGADPDYYTGIYPANGATASYYDIEIEKTGTKIYKLDYDVPRKDGNNSDLSLSWKQHLNMAKALKEYFGEEWTKVKLRSGSWGKETISARVMVTSQGQIEVRYYDPLMFAEAMGHPEKVKQ